VEDLAVEDLPTPLMAWADEDALARSELDAMPFICSDGLVSGAAKHVVGGFLLCSRVGMIDSFI